MGSHGQEREPVAPGNVLAGFDHPDSSWNLAAAASENSDPFCCRNEWQLAYHEVSGPDRALHLRQGGDSFLALAEQGPGMGSWLGPIEAHWMFGCPLLGPDAVALLEEHLAELQRRHRRRVAVLISGVLPRSALRRRIGARLGGRYEIHRHSAQEMCAASLAGGLDGYLSRRSGHWRRNVLRAARRAAQAGVVFERRAPATVAEARSVYQRMLAVERASWKGLERCGMAEPPSRQLYGRVLERMAASARCRIVFARHDGSDIGFIFGGLGRSPAGAVYRGQQFSYVQSWSRASIGNVLQLEQIRWLCEEAAVRYDMGPLMPYKRHWAELRWRPGTLILAPK